MACHLRGFRKIKDEHISSILFNTFSPKYIWHTAISYNYIRYPLVCFAFVTWLLVGLSTRYSSTTFSLKISRYLIIAISSTILYLVSWMYIHVTSQWSVD